MRANVSVEVFLRLDLGAGILAESGMALKKIYGEMLYGSLLNIGKFLSVIEGMDN